MINCVRNCKISGGATCRGVQLGRGLPGGDEKHEGSRKCLLQQPFLWGSPEKQPDVPWYWLWLLFLDDSLQVIRELLLNVYELLNFVSPSSMFVSSSMFIGLLFRNRQSFPSAKSRDLQISINTDNNKVYNARKCSQESMFNVYWLLISRNKPWTRILFASSRTGGHSAPGIEFETHHQPTSMPMSGRSSRSRRRWSTSWRSTICPTASTATGRAVTAATGWPDIGVSLQPIYSTWFILSHQGRTILGCWQSKPAGTLATCSTIARALEAPTTPAAPSHSTGPRVLLLLEITVTIDTPGI